MTYLSPPAPGVTDRALLLTPSRGLGGGIERYVETLEWAFTERGIEYRRVDLQQPGPTGHARIVVEARRQMRALGAPARLVVAHRSLLPAAWLLARGGAAAGISILCHGNDVWGDGRGRGRRSVEDRLMRVPGVRVVAVSSFTAGALARHCQATVLRPGLSREWFDLLVKASAGIPVQDGETHLVTTFRLGQWRGKGLPELLAAVTALDRDDIRVTVCGSGRPPPALELLLHQHPCCTLRPGCTDRELADLLASADLFVLATRTRGGHDTSGEGFGLVLLEAQVAGTPVVAPAYGGSHEAYLDRVTGFAPTDESAGQLEKVLREVLGDPDRLAAMGRRAADWARECFAPEEYASAAVERLL
ncbi:MAG: glycosyltransferase family 4 protein [Streptosporangiaceae bacterium]